MKDSTDIKIINCLLENGRISLKEISSRVGISNVAVQQRIKKLEEQDVIKAYNCDVDLKKLGYHTIAFVGIFLEKAKNYKEVISELNKIDQITEAHFTTGNYSIFAKIYARDNDHLMDILTKHVQSLEGIARTETFISLNEGVQKVFQIPVEE